MDPPQLRRGLFGYSAKSVRRLLAAREQIPVAEGSRSAAEARARETEDRAVAAEARAADLDLELRAVGAELGRRNEELRASQDRVAGLEPKLTVLRSALTREMQSVWAADRRIYEMGTELAAAREELMALAGDLATQASRADMAEIRAAGAVDEAARHDYPWTADELASVFEIAEQAVARIIQEARRRGEEELRAVEVERARVQGEIEHLLAWGERVGPLVDPLRESVEEAQVESERLGALIGEALEPMTTAVTALRGKLRDLEAATAVPGEADRIVDVSEQERTGIAPPD